MFCQLYFLQTEWESAGHTKRITVYTCTLNYFGMHWRINLKLVARMVMDPLQHASK